ncbi:hypothetical protein [Paenibacillus senegalensis]|uniref:hypothetical protein n=1 Tax=Paenibacillus senegalensis TaxID=1465766 RepID=UPI0002882F6E|nr:hypothetical protein [Paenibacillus senegalensis]
MNTQVLVPKGNETVSVQLTVKELMALSGERFPYDNELMSQLKKKLKRSLERELLDTDNRPISFHQLNM